MQTIESIEPTSKVKVGELLTTNLKNNLYIDNDTDLEIGAVLKIVGVMPTPSTTDGSRKPVGHLQMEVVGKSKYKGVVFGVQTYH